MHYGMILDQLCAGAHRSTYSLNRVLKLWVSYVPLTFNLLDQKEASIGAFENSYTGISFNIMSISRWYWTWEI